MIRSKYKLRRSKVKFLVILNKKHLIIQLIMLIHLNIIIGPNKAKMLILFIRNKVNHIAVQVKETLIKRTMTNIILMVKILQLLVLKMLTANKRQWSLVLISVLLRQLKWICYQMHLRRKIENLLFNRRYLS